MAKEVKEEKNSKIAALEAAIDHINKQYGAGAVMKLGENTHMTVETISTGSLSLDLALGVGGVPKGRIIEIYGPESGGKTTMALHMVAEVQKTGGVAAFIDAEHALDPSYARNIGVDIDDLYVSQPDCGEQALEITETMVRSGAVDIVVVDSVAALTPKAEIDGDMGDPHVGLQARLMSQALRKPYGCDCEYQMYCCIHQSVERKGRHYVWKPGDNGRRACTQILCFRPSGCKKNRDGKERGAGGF